jgi:hypothetical protein
MILMAKGTKQIDVYARRYNHVRQLLTTLQSCQGATSTRMFFTVSTVPQMHVFTYMMEV